MRDLRKRLLERFYKGQGDLSRNRHFHAFLDPAVRQASRAARLLRSLKQDLLDRDLSALSLSPIRLDGEEAWVVLHLEWEGGKRISYLTEVEMEMLREDERIDRLISLAHGTVRSGS